MHKGAYLAFIPNHQTTQQLILGNSISQETNCVNFSIEGKEIFNSIRLSLQIDTKKPQNLSALRRLLAEHAKYIKLNWVNASGRVNVHNFMYYLTHSWSSVENVSLKFDKKVCFYS